MIFKIDLKKLNTKPLALKELATVIPEMFGLNYDALIDSATFFDEPLCIELENIDCFDDKQNLLEVFDIITNENPKFTYSIKS